MRGMVIPTTFTAINRFSGPVGSMTRSMAGFIGTSQMYASSVGRVFRGALKPMADFQNALRGIGVYFGLFSAFMILRNAVKTMADFEESQINIKSVIGDNIRTMPILAMQARKMAVDYGFAAKEVAGLQYELIKMGFDKRKGGIQNVLDATPAIALGARAMKGSPDEVAKIVGSGTALFPDKTPQQLVDLYAKGLDISALDFENFTTMLRNSQQAWAMTKRSPEELVAVLAVLSNAFVHTASAGTGVKNMMIDNAISGKQFEDQLNKILASENPLKTIYKMYGRKTLQSASPLANAFGPDGDYKSMLATLQQQSDGYAKYVNDIRSASINMRIEKVKTAYQEMILAIDDGTGKFAAAIRQYLDVARAMLLITGDSVAAREALSKMETTTVELANKYLGWLETAWKIVKVLLIIKAVMLVVNGILLISRALWIAYSVVMGIFTFVTGMGTRAIIGNAIAMNTARIATRAWTAGLFLARGAMQLFNLVMAGSPLGLLIVGLGVVLANLVDINSEWSIWAGNIQKMKMEKDRGIMEDFKLSFNDEYKSGVREIRKKNPGFTYSQADSAYVATQNMKYDSAMARMNPMAGLDSLGAEKNDLSFLNAKKNSLQDAEISNQKQNVTIDINNNTGNKIKSKQTGKGVPVRVGSTWMFNNDGDFRMSN